MTDDHAPQVRADQALVRSGLARSRALAQEYIKQGRVRWGTQVIAKPAEQVPADAALVLAGPPEPWVGRAAYKLLAAVDSFGPRGWSVQDRRCLDVGASTGGFTQVLLRHGACQVTALDVGHGQLAPEVAGDPRVIDRSGTHIRHVRPDELGGPFACVVSDLSFISLRLALAPMAGLLQSDGDLITLVKPQFEVGREAIGRTGVVRSLSQRAAAVQAVVAAARQVHLEPHGVITSPVVGASGNEEYLLWLRAAGPGMMSAMDIDAAVRVIERGEPLR